MKTIFLRRFTALVALLGIIICVVLILNFTASNPTGRRYSSDIPLVQGSAQEIGFDGERILSKDLGLPPNDRADQRQCICANAAFVPGECNSCFATLHTLDTFRRPDFISSNFIAESKNRRNLFYTDRDFDQLQDYAAVAKALDIPLWVYVRVNTNIDPEYESVVKATGGGIVRYFRVEDYTDPTHRGAQIGILICVSVLGGIVLIEVINRLTPPDIIQEPEDFIIRVKSKTLSEIDREDSRQELQ